MSLPITNIVTVQVSRSPVGLANYRVNNLLILTEEEPVDASFGEYAVYKTPSDVATDWGTNSEVYDMAVAIFSQQPNILSGDGALIIAPLDTSASETLQEGILRMMDAVYFGGILWAGFAPTQGEILDAAQTAQSESKLFFVSDYLASSMQPGGTFYEIKSQTLTYSRRFLYTASATAARVAMAAYAGRSMSVNFSGSNTTQTMQLKDLIGIAADTGITQTIYNTAEESGVDVYGVFGPGLPCVISNSGGLGFFDQVYNLNWLKFALEVACFNVLRQTSTKIPQTETGMAVIKGAIITVLNQAVANQYLAPGSWTSPDRFGNPEDMLRSVLENGWYYYSQPVTEQNQADREARIAPLIQVACKEAGAVHHVLVNVYVNA